MSVVQWIDSLPWWSVVLASFAVGSLLGIVLRVARGGKQEPREA